MEYIKLLVEIASFQTSYKAIDECLKITNRRVNALEYIVVPRIRGVMHYIDTELQEREKEDKFRIKKVLQNKAKHKENEEQILKGNIEEIVAEENIMDEEEEDEILF